MKKVIILLLLCTCFVAKAQRDTLLKVYYNASWQECSEKNASYYRLLYRDEAIDTLYIVEDYYLNGQIQMSGKISYIFNDNAREGYHVFYNEDGTKNMSGSYFNNKKYGKWEYWDKRGKKKVKYYKADEVVTTESDTLPNPNQYKKDDKVFVLADVMPSFTEGSGKDGFRNYIFNNLQYPLEARKFGLTGTVYIKFVVDTRGYLTEIEVVRGCHPLLDNEALRVICQSPRWESPGYIENKPVNVQFVFPLKFVLQEEDDAKTKVE